MVGVLGHQHVGQQACGGEAFVDDLSRHGGLHQALAGAAGPLAAHMALDREDARGVVKLLGHILADAFHLAATGAGGGVGFVADLGAGQLWGQCLALGPALGGGLGGRGAGLQLGQFLFQGGDVGLNGFFKQGALLGIELFALHAEANAPQLGQLKAEFVDLGVSQRNGLAGLFSALGILLDAGKQLSGERTQFIRGHGGQGLGVELRQGRHSFKYAAAWGGSPSAHALIAGRPELKRG